MRRILTAMLLIVIVAGCGATASPAPYASAGAAISTPEAASAAAVRLASIGGPLTIDEVQHGTYADLWAGSTNDLSGQGTADRNAKAGLLVWRVDVMGPSGREQLYVDGATGALVNAITQGS